MNTFLENRAIIMKEARSGIAQENLQEVLDAEDNAGWTLQGGQNQYLTPEWLAKEWTEKLGRLLGSRCGSALDPQCGDGALVKPCSYSYTYGIDIDNRLDDTYGDQVAHRITGHCVKVMEAFDDIYPGTRWDWINCNPPFGKRWKLATGQTMDSTEFTWHWATAHGNAGFFISNKNTIEKLNIHKHPWVIEYPTVAEVSPEAIAHFTGVLDGCEMIAGYKYYPGQKTFIPRVAVKDHALVASATGAGKTLKALSLLACKGPDRCLIIAPQGCIRSGESDDDEDGADYQAAQWITEINKFAPYMQIWELFSLDDYHRICAMNRGKLPPGVYVTYYQAFFRNRAQETTPPGWNDERLEKELNTLAATNVTLPKVLTHKRFWCDGIGRETEGIRCIISPCLATLIAHNFDMVLLDECHIVTNLAACVTQMLIRLQPKYRYAFSATPITDIVSNLFSLMGWICVDDWFKGNRRNAAWPFARSDLKFFENTFMCMERDFTQEHMNKDRDPEWNGKCVKASPRRWVESTASTAGRA